MANGKGDNTPPCFTQFLTIKQFDTTCPHLTLSVWLVYMYNNNLYTIGEISCFNKSLNNLQ